jgi:hypothetical protein
MRFWLRCSDQQTARFFTGPVLKTVGTDQEIDLIARVLLAQVVQVGQITRVLPGISPARLPVLRICGI